MREPEIQLLLKGGLPPSPAERGLLGSMEAYHNLKRRLARLSVSRTLRLFWPPSFLRHFRKRLAKRFASRLISGDVRPSIGEALSGDVGSQFFGAILVADAERYAVVVAEIELCEIAVQVLLGTMLVRPAHAAFEH